MNRRSSAPAHPRVAANGTATPTDCLASTHEVFNQSPPLEDYDSYRGDTALCEAVRRHGAGWAEEELSEHGRRCTRPEVLE